MEKESVAKTRRPLKQRHFVARELQYSVALLIVLALLGGIFLQAISSVLIDYYGVKTPVLGFLLVIGYVLLVVVLAVFFTHRLVGPFKRLEYEMKFITSGELNRRLSVRSQDDLHVRNFVNNTNEFLSNFENMSKEYNLLNSTVSKKLEELTRELSKESADCARVREEIGLLVKEIHKFREKW